MPGIFYRVEIDGQHCGGSTTLPAAVALLADYLAGQHQNARRARIVSERSGGGGFREETIYSCERGQLERQEFGLGVRRVGDQWDVKIDKRPLPASTSKGPRVRISDLAR
jgi:hypothetical protein